MDSASPWLHPLCAQRMSRVGTMMLLIFLLFGGAHGQSCQVCSAGSYAALCVRSPALPTCLPCASPCEALTSFDVGCSAESPLSDRLCIPKAPLAITPNVQGLRVSNIGAEGTVSLTRSAASRGVAEGWPLTFGEPATVNATLKNALVELVLRQSPVASTNSIDWSLVNVSSGTPLANLVWSNALGVGDIVQRTLTVRVNTGSTYDGRLPVNAVRPLFGIGSPSLLPYPWRSVYGEVLVRNVSGDAGLSGTASIRPGQAIPLWVENADSGPVCYSKPKLSIPYSLQSVTSSPVIETVLLPAAGVAVTATRTAWVQPIRMPIGRASDSLFITSTGGEWSTGVQGQTALPMLTGLSIPLMRMGSRARATWVRGNTARLRLVYELWANTVPAPYTDAFLSAMDGGSTYPQQVGTQPIGQTLVRTSSSPIAPTTGTLLYRFVDEVPNLAQPVAGGTTALPASESNLNNTWLGMLPLNPPIPLTPDVPYGRWKDWEVQVGNVTLRPFGMSFFLVVSTQMPVEAGMPVHGDAANGLEGPSYGLRQAAVNTMPAAALAQQWGLDGNLQAWNSSSALWEDAGSLPIAVGFHTCSVRGLGRSPVLATPACPQFSTGACTLPVHTPDGFPTSLVKVAPGVVSYTVEDKLFYPNGTLSFHPIGRNVAGAPGLTPAQASALPGLYTQVLLDGQHASTSIAWSSKPDTRPPSQYWDGSTWADTGVTPQSLPYNMAGVWYLVEDVTEAAVRQYIPATMLAPQAPGGGLDPNGNDGVTPLLPETGYLGRTDAWLSSVPPSYLTPLTTVWPADPPVMLGLYPPGDAEYMARSTVYRLGNPMIVSQGGSPYFYPLLSGETVRQGVEWPARLWGQGGVLAGTPLENRSHIEFKFRLRLPWKDLLDGVTYLEPGKDVVTIRVCAPWAVAAAVAACPLSALPDILTGWGEQGWVDERTPFAMTMVDGAGLLVQSSILARTRPGSALIAALNSSVAPASSGLQWQGTAPAFRGMTTATPLDPLTTWRSPGYDCQRGLAPLDGRSSFCQWAPPLFLTLPAQLRLGGLNNGTGLGINTAVEIAPFAMRADMPLALQTLHTGPFAPLHPNRAWRLGQDMRGWGQVEGRGWLWTMDGQLAINGGAASSAATNQSLARSLPYVDLSIGMGGGYYLGAPYTPWAESDPVMMPGGLGQWAGETVFGGRAVSTLPGSSLVSSMGGVSTLWDRSKHSTLRVYSPWTPMASLPAPQGVLQGYAPSRNDNAFGWEVQTSSGGPALGAAAWWSTEMLFINVYPLMYPAALGTGAAPSAPVTTLDAMGYPYKLSKLPPPPAMSWTHNPASNATSVLEKYRAVYAVRPQYPEGSSEQEPQAQPDVAQAVGLNVKRFSMSSWSCSGTPTDNVVTRVPTSHAYAGTGSINVSVWYPEPYQLAHPTVRLCEVGYGTWMDLHFGPGQDKATIPLSIHPDPWGDVSGVPVLQGTDLDRHYVVCAVTLSNPRGVPMDKKTFGGIDNGLVQGRTTRYIVLCRGRGTSSPSDPYGTQYDCPTTTQALPGYLPQVITAVASVNGAQGLPVPGVVAGRRPPSLWNATSPLGLIEPAMSRTCKGSSVLGSVESLSWSTTWPTQVRFLPLGSSVTLAQQGVPINPWEATVLRTPYVFSGPTGPTQSYPDFAPSPAPGNSTSTPSPTPTASVTPLPSASSVRGRPEDGLGGGWATSGQPWTIRVPVIRAVSSVPQNSAETPLGPWSEVYARAKAAEAAVVTYRLSISGPSYLSPDSTGCTGLQGGAWDNAFLGLNTLLSSQPGVNPCSGLAERVLGEDFQVTVSWGAGDYTDTAYRAAVAVSATPSATVSASRTPSPTSTPSASMNASASPSPWFNMEFSPAPPPLLPISPGGVGPGQWDMARDPRVRYVEITFRRGDPLRLLNVPALTFKLSPVVTTGVGVARSPAIPDFFIHLCASSTNISSMYDSTLARVCTGAATVQRQQGSSAGYAQPTASQPRPPAIVGFSSPLRPVFMGDPFSPSPSPPMMPTQTAWPSMFGPPKRRVAAHDGMATMESEAGEAERQLLNDDEYGGYGGYIQEQCAAADDFGDSGRRYVGGTFSCVSHHAGWQPLPFSLSSLPDFPENWGSTALSSTTFSFFPAMTLRAVLTASVPAGPAMMGLPQMQPILFNSREVEIPLAWEDIVYLPQSMSVWDQQFGSVRVPRAFPAMLRKNVEFIWSTAGPFVFYGLTGGYERAGLSGGMQSGTGRPAGTGLPPVETGSPSVNASSSPSPSASSTRSAAPSISSTPTAGFVQPGWPFPSNWTELNITFVLDPSGLNGIAQVDPARNTFTLQYLRPIGPRTVGGGLGGSSASPTRQSITRAPSVATPNVTLSLSLTGFNLTVLISGDRFVAMTTAAIVAGVNAALQQSGRALSSGVFRNESVGIRRAWTIPTPASGLAPQVIFINPQYAWEFFPEAFAAMSQQQGGGSSSGSGSTFSPLPSFTQNLTGTPRARILQGGGGGPDFSTMLGLRVDIVLLLSSQSDVGTMGPLLDPSSPTQQRATFQQATASAYRSQDSVNFPSATFTVIASAPEYILSSGATATVTQKPRPSAVLPRLTPPTVARAVAALDLGTVVTVASRGSIGANGQEAISGMGAFPLAVPAGEEQAWKDWVQSAVGSPSSGDDGWYSRVGGRTWTDLSLLSSLIDWLGLPTGGPQGQRAGLQLLNLASEWNPTSPDALHARLASSLLPPSWGAGDSMAAWAYGRNTSSIMPPPGVRRLQSQGPPPGLEAYSGGILVTRTQLHEPLVLSADVWAFPKGWTTANSGLDSMGTQNTGAGGLSGFLDSQAQLLPGGPRAVQRAIVTGQSTLFIPDGLGDSRAPGVTAGNRSADRLTASNPYSPVLSIPGLAVSVSRVTWVLTGIPSPAMDAVWRAAGVTPPHGLPTFPNGTSTGMRQHTLTFTTSTLVATVPPGRLLAGYVYTITASVAGAARLLYADPIVPAAAGGPGGSGTFVPRTLQGTECGPAGCPSGVSVPASNVSATPTPSPSASTSAALPVWRHPTTAVAYLLPIPPTLPAALAAPLLASTGHGVVGQVYSVSAASVDVNAVAVKSSTVYVHAPPGAGALERAPNNGTALLTRFTLRSAGWTEDTAARSTAAVPSIAAVVSHLTQAPLPPAVINAWAGVAQGRYTGWDALSELTRASAGGSLCTVARNQAVPPAWLIRQSLIALALGTGLDLTCSTVETSTRAALIRLADSYNRTLGALPVGLPSFTAGLVLPLNYRHTPALDARALFLPPTLVGTGSQLHSFRVDPTGQAPNGTLALSPVQDISGYSAQLADYAVSPNSWAGSPLAATGPASQLQSTLPIPPQGRTILHLYAFVRDEEGAVALATAPVAVTLDLRQSGSEGSVGAASAASSFATQVATTLTRDSVSANPFGALLTTASLTNVLANASSSGVGNGTLPTGAEGRAELAELRRNNTALRQSLVDTVGTAVSSIANSSARSIGSSSLSGLLSNWSITVSVSERRDSNASQAGGSTSGPIDAAIVGNITTEALQALRSDTSIALDDGTAVTAASALASLTSDPTELSNAAGSSALSTLSTVLALSLPTNVLMGVSDDGDDLSGAQLGGNASGIGVEVVRSVSPPDPALLSAGASVALNVLTSNTMVDSNATQSAGDMADREAIREQVQTTLTLLASTMARDAIPGDPPRSVAAGPTEAFKSAVNNARRLQGQAPLAPESFCGQALVLTTARLSSTNGSAQYNVAVEDTFNPCLSKPDSAAAQALSAAGAGNTQARVVVSEKFVSSGSRSRLVDMQVVQMSDTFGLPEDSGFDSFTFTRTGGGRGGRALSLLGGLLGSGATTTPVGATAAISGLGVSSFAKPTVTDLQPSTGLDSRVLQVNLQTRSGRAVPVTNAPEPIYLTIPLKDFSRPGASVAGEVADAHVVQRFTFTCPVENDAVAVLPGAALPAVRTNSSAQYAFGMPDILRLAAITQVTYISDGSDKPREPSTCRLPFTSCDSSGKPSGSYSFSNAAQQAGEAARDVTGGGLRQLTRPVFVLTVPCGGLPGPRNISCGPGAYGNVSTYTCPSVIAQPVCTWWDERAGRWAGEGCTVVNVTIDSVTCACTHLTEFAARFAALAADNNDIFAQVLNLGAADYSKAMLMLGIVGSIMLALFVSVILTHTSDKYGDVRFYSTLLADEEVQFLRRIEELKGHTFILDRRLDARKQIAMQADGAEGKKLDGEEGRESKAGWSSWLRGETAGPTTAAPTDPMKGGEEKMVMHTNPHMSKLDAAQTAAVKGRRLTTAEQTALASNEASRRRAIEAKHRQAAHSGAAGEAGAAGTGTAVAAGSVAAEMAAEDIVTVLGNGRADPYSAALYMRLMEQFEPYRVTADKLAGSAQGKEATAVLGRMVDADMAQELVKDDAAFSEDSPATGEQGKGSAAAMIFKLSRSSSNEEGDEGEGSEGKRAGFRPMGFALTWATRASRTEVVKVDQAAIADKPAEAAFASAALPSDGQEHASTDSAAAPATPAAGSNKSTSRLSSPMAGLGGVMRNMGTSFKNNVQRLAASAAGRGEFYKMAIISKAKRKMDVLDDTSAWSCMRAYRLRNFIFKVWLLRLWFTHTYFSIYTRYDPRSPRTGRLLLLASVIIGNMFVTAFFYAFRNGRPGQDLPAMTASETIVLAILASLIQQPIEIVLKTVIEWAGQSEFTSRYPYLWSELNRRKAAEKKLAGMSREALAAELALSGKDTKEDAVELAGELAKQAAQGAAKAVSSAAAAAGGPTPSATVSGSAYLTTAAAQGLISPTIVDGAAAAPTVDPAATAEDSGETFEYGWVDAPPELVRTCPCVLRACGRHPAQKATFIAKAAGEEAARMEARRRKLVLQQAKKKEQAEARKEQHRVKLAAKAAARRRAAQRKRFEEEQGKEDGGSALPTVATVAAGVAATAATMAVQGSLESGGVFASPSPAAQAAAVASEEDVDAGEEEEDLGDVELAEDSRASRGDGAVESFSDGGAGLETDEDADGEDDEEGGVEFEGDLEGILTAEDAGDYCAAICTTLCGALAAASASRGSRAANKSVKATISKTKSGRYLTQTQDGRQMITTTVPKKIKPKQSEEKSKESKRLDEEDDEEHMKEIADTARGYMRAACGVCPCTLATLMAYAVCGAWVAFCLFYLTLFGLYQPQEATTDFVGAFFISQAFGLFMVQPGILLVMLILQLAIFPAWVPYLLWVPVLGPMVAGKAASTVQGDGTSALTGRMENLTLIRAAGAASMLAPDSALIAYGTTAVLGAAMGGAGRAISKAAASRKRRAEGRVDEESGRGKDGSAATPSALATLTNEERHELIVRRYLVAQLKVAEAARRKKINREKVKQLAFAATTAVNAFKEAGSAARAAGEREGGEVVVQVAAAAPASGTLAAAAAAFRRGAGRAAAGPETPVEPYEKL